MNRLPSEIVHLVLGESSLETCVALGDVSRLFKRLTDEVLEEKVKQRCPFMTQRTEMDAEQTSAFETASSHPRLLSSKSPNDTPDSWRFKARTVISRKRRKNSFLLLSEEQQDPLVYSLKLGMKTLSYVLKIDLDACRGLVDTNNHVWGDEEMKHLCQDILKRHAPITSRLPDLSHVTFPEQVVHNFIHHPHSDFVFFSMLQPKGWFLYCAVDKNPLLTIFGPFAFSHPDSFRVFTYGGLVYVDFDGAVLPFVVDLEDQKVRFYKEKMIHGFPEQHGRAFIQGKGDEERFLCNENGKRICDLDKGVNYLLD